MKKLLILMLAGASLGLAYQPYNGFCENGGQAVTVAGYSSSATFQQTYPTCNVAVFDHASVGPGSYSTGGSISGSANQTCVLTFIAPGKGSGATATVPLTGSNAIAPGTPYTLITPGSGYTLAPTSATLSNGTATCSGTATVVTTVCSTILATLYSDNIGTPLANPFPSSATGYYQFYAADGRYDVTFSGGGIPAPFTIFDQQLLDWLDVLNGAFPGTVPFSSVTGITPTTPWPGNLPYGSLTGVPTVWPGTIPYASVTGAPVVPGGTDGQAQFNHSSALTGLTTNSQVQFYVNALAPTWAGGCGIHEDGTTDDAALLNTCIASLVSAGGGVIQIPPGTVAISSTGLSLLGSKVRLRGTSSSTPAVSCAFFYSSSVCSSSTILKAVGSWPASGGALVTVNGTTTAQGYESGSSLENLDLDCNQLCSIPLLLTHFSGGTYHDLHLHNHTSTAAGGEPGLYIKTDNTGATGACGGNSGLATFKTISIDSNFTGGAGIQLGTAGSTKDSCSNTFEDINVTTMLTPGTHKLLIANSDSNKFSHLNFADYIDITNPANNKGQAFITSILATSSTAATITATAHGMPAGTTGDGVFIEFPCTIPLVGNTCNGSFVQGLAGALEGTYVDANTISVTGAFGLTMGVTYYAKLLTGTSIEISGSSCPGGCTQNSFFTDAIVCEGMHTNNAYGTFNGYDGYECPGTFDPGYIRIAGANTGGWIQESYGGYYLNFNPLKAVRFNVLGGDTTANVIPAYMQAGWSYGSCRNLGHGGCGAQTPLINLDTNELTNFFNTQTGSNNAFNFFDGSSVDVFKIGTGTRGVIANGPVNSLVGFQVNGTATLNHCLVGNGTNYVDGACPAGGGGIGYPPAGIGVSSGAAWLASLNAASPTFTSTVTGGSTLASASGFLVPNTVAYGGKDSGGATHLLLSVNAGNNILMESPAGFVWFDDGSASTLMTLTGATGKLLNQGVIQAGNGLGAGSAAFLVPNGYFYGALDSGATAQKLLGLNGSNQTVVGSPIISGTALIWQDGNPTTLATLASANTTCTNCNSALAVAGPIQANATVGAVTFAHLAACAAGLEGTLVAVSDSTTVVWGDTITGTGANHVLAYCDGTNWTVAAK